MKIHFKKKLPIFYYTFFRKINRFLPSKIPTFHSWTHMFTFISFPFNFKKSVHTVRPLTFKTLLPRESSCLWYFGNIWEFFHPSTSETFVVWPLSSNILYHCINLSTLSRFSILGQFHGRPSTTISIIIIRSLSFRTRLIISNFGKPASSTRFNLMTLICPKSSFAR